MLQALVPHANKLKYLLNQNSPTILTAVGVAGTVATAYLSGKASFKAAEIIRAEQEDAEMDLPTTTKVRLVWRQFVPPIAAGALTIGSIITANRISSTRIAALTIAAGASERALQEYRDKVVEKLGEKRDQEVRDEIAQDRVGSNPTTLVVGDGKVLCYDMLTGRYFQSSMEEIRRAENRINKELLHYMSASLSFFYEEIGLEPTSYSDYVGWTADNLVEVKFSTVLSPDQRPCIAIDFVKQPTHDYDRQHG